MRQARAGVRTAVSEKRRGDLVALEAKPLLKQLGYRKKGWTWVKEGDPLTKLFTIDFHRGGPASERKFTIRLDVCSWEMRAAAGHPERPEFIQGSGFPSLYASTLVGRSGYWTFNEAGPLNETERDSFLSAVGTGAEWLESFATFQDCFDWFVATRDAKNASVAAHVLGRDDVGYWLREVLKLGPGEKVRGMLEHRAERWGVPLA